MNVLTMRLSCFIFFILFFSLHSVASKTIINGVAPGAEGKTIQLSMPGDLITFTDKPLASAKVDSSGHFKLSVDLIRTIYSVITIDFHKTELYIEPARTYNITIAPMNYDENTEVNPFILSQNLSVEVADTSKQELNAMINSFNAIFSAFLEPNFKSLYFNHNKQLLDTFKIQLNQYFGVVENDYFISYAVYKLASLEQLTKYFNQAQLIKNYFTNKQVLYNNLSYMDFFNSFFSKYITVTSTILHKADWKSLLSGPDPYNTVRKFMATDTLLKNEQVRELVMLKGMMELYNTPGYNQEQVLTILNMTKEKAQYLDNREVAANMIRFLTNLKPGTAAPEFTLINRDQKEVSLKSLQGKPVMLCFWATYCEGCLSEMDLIRPLYDKYKDGIQFVSISADKYFSKMSRFINLKKDYVWTFLNIGDHPDVLKDYDVRAYPLFVLIDREGKIFKYPAGQPSSGLEADLQKILQ
jgi:peroxiredoxin